MNNIAYRPISKNSRVGYDYDISSTLIAGIVLSGAEVKSIRNGALSLKGSFANFSNGELWLNNMHISRYPHAAYKLSYDPSQPRKLLLSKNEIVRLAADRQNGKHIVIKSIGISGKYIKAELGIGSSKKLYDKRQKIKSRSQLRDAQKAQAHKNKA